MRPLLLSLTALALGLSLSAPAVAAPPAHVAAALADSGRPVADREKDALRKPGELVAFAGIQPGHKVGDLIMGGGYFTRIFAKAVGPQGKVYAYQPTEFIRFSAKYGEDMKTVGAAYPNVTTLSSTLGELRFPETLDVVWTSQNYHDFHLKPFPADTSAKVNKAVFDALKPGGVYVVIDHHAAPASGTSAADSLHRIDIEAVKAEVTAAGFVLDGESDLLRLPSDPRTAIVFDPSVRGKTDQFVLRFRKPA